MANDAISQQKKIVNLIETRYNLQSQYLDLQCQQSIWKDVLRYKDWKQLRSLILNQCQIKGTDVFVLTVRNWRSLSLLQLADNQLGNEGANKIWRKQWPNLDNLWLNKNTIQANGLSYIPNARMTNLKQLYLHKNPIGSQGVKQLTKADLPKLQVVILSDCTIGTQGAIYLAKGKWTNLKQLWLNQNFISFDGNQCLANTDLKKAINININNNVFASSVITLVKINAPKKCKLSYFFNGNYCEQINDMVGYIMYERFQYND